MNHESTSERRLEELRGLISGLCDGELQPHEAARLEELVATDKACCSYYVTVMHINSALPRYVGADRRSISSRIAEQQLLAAVPRSDLSVDEEGAFPSSIEFPSPPCDQSAELPQRSIPAPCDPPPTDGLSDGTSTGGWSLLGWKALSLMAIAICIATFGGTWLLFWPRSDSVSILKAVEVESSDKTPSEKLVASAAYVARVVKTSSDCIWGNSARPGEFLLRCKAGSKIAVAAGLAELEFHSGARVILHGPTEFTPTGPASGRLDSGRLTGKVENGNFRLITPAAEVIDLGTEFGVVADASLGSDVVVFDGRVQVVSRPDRLGVEKRLDLTEGMAARFHFDGTTEYGPQTDAKQFQRTVDAAWIPASENEICLIDVVGGGDGMGAHLAGAINPLTGQKDYGEGRQPVSGCIVSDGHFHRCAWHPLINGVFIPAPHGQGVQLDSAGHKFDLPPGHGMTWSCLWARSKQSIDQPHSAEENDFWGARTLGGILKRLKDTNNGIMGIHANVGITFDLQAVRLLHRRSPTSLRGTVANLEASGEFAPEQVIIEQRTADLRVLVDGDLRYSRLGFRRADGETEFNVPLSESDRFVTIISSDDGNYSWDQVVLIDPVLVLPNPASVPQDSTR